MPEPEELYIGLMSGTSVDGIDAALVAFESQSTLRVIDTAFTPFPDAVRDEINRAALNNARLHNNEDSPLHTALAEYYAQASLDLLHNAGVSTSRITAIANHGQTVRHEPNIASPFTLQLGDGQLIADLTGIPTITQFRQADIAAGGQGAPLMPAFHKAMFGQVDNALVLNLGGIANITQLGSQVVGFDTGPANCLLDQWINRHKNQRFDKDGKWAASGRVIDTVLATLLREPYLEQSHPKSTGTDYFNLDWLNARIPDLDSHAPEDVQATLLAFTIETVKLAIRQLTVTSGSLFVCGGGAQNPALMQGLREELNAFRVADTEALGVPSDWVEAVGFAWLGYCFVHGLPSNLPSVTGANRALVLGELFSPTNTSNEAH